MTLCLPLRSSLLTVGRRRSCRIVSHRVFSSKQNDGASPLLLWIESSNHTTAPPPRILMPNSSSSLKLLVASPNDVVEAVDNHYTLSSDSEQFVGGMGESDAGVWFACETQDPLHHYPLLQESIQQVKQSRHGVPFGVYTSGVGLPSDLPPLKEIGLGSVQVSLMASNPKEYAQATGLSDAEAMKAFGQVCGFCVTLHESGFPFEVCVLQPYASSARDLAVSLGAVDTHVHQE